METPGQGHDLHAEEFEHDHEAPGVVRMIAAVDARGQWIESAPRDEIENIETWLQEVAAKVLAGRSRREQERGKRRTPSPRNIAA